MFDDVVSFIRELYDTEGLIPLHEPRFSEREKETVLDCIDSTFVSSVGSYVDLFEQKVADFTGAKYAVAVINGTQALFVALLLAGANRETEVITQSLTFVATANAIHYTGAEPVFIDVDRETLGLSADSLLNFLKNHTYLRKKENVNRHTGKKIVACVPMHTLGHPCRVKEIKEICEEFQIVLIEDAAESIGSYVGKIHTGRFGQLSILSFNGNKIITTGSGGIIMTDDEKLAQKARHLTTTAKLPHKWEFNHDEIGYNFRMPNLNAALGVAQLEKLPDFLNDKRRLANTYRRFFINQGIKFFDEPTGTKSNYWLNTILLKNRMERNEFLGYSNQNGVMTRCLWTPMHCLPMYRKCQKDSLSNTQYLFDRIVNIPSSVRIK